MNVLAGLATLHETNLLGGDSVPTTSAGKDVARPDDIEAIEGHVHVTHLFRHLWRDTVGDVVGGIGGTNGAEQGGGHGDEKELHAGRLHGLLLA